jgi:hypothetical protein
LSIPSFELQNFKGLAWFIIVVLSFDNKNFE